MNKLKLVAIVIASLSVAQPVLAVGGKMTPPAAKKASMLESNGEAVLKEVLSQF